jgi:hypothetical protein
MNEFLPFCIFFCVPTLYLPAYNRGHENLMVSQVIKKFPALLQNLKIHCYVHLPEPDESSLHLHIPFRIILMLSFFYALNVSFAVQLTQTETTEMLCQNTVSTTIF